MIFISDDIVNNTYNMDESMFSFKQECHCACTRWKERYKTATMRKNNCVCANFSQEISREYFFMGSKHLLNLPYQIDHSNNRPFFFLSYNIECSDLTIAIYLLHFIAELC